MIYTLGFFTLVVLIALTALILACVGFELHDRRKAREWVEWEKNIRQRLRI